MRRPGFCTARSSDSSDPVAKARPVFPREQPEPDDHQLADDETHEPFEGGVHESVGMQTDAEHVHAEPRPARDNVADDGAIDKTALADHSAPSQMQNQRVPKHDDERTVFLRIPAPEPAPG